MKSLRLLLVLVLACLVPGRIAAQEGRDGAERQKITTWQLVNLFEGSADLRGFNAEHRAQAARCVEETLGQGQIEPTSIEQARKVFTQYSFEEIEALAKAGKISTEHSDILARQRQQMIRQAMTSALKELDPEHQLTVCMLDSGNKSSGIASDVDQTIFLLPPDLARRLGIDETKAIAAFDEHFKRLHGVAPARLGVESMNGADFFPDWRARHSVAEFTVEARRVVETKLPNPEAYRSEGELKIQAEGRGHQAIMEHGQRIADLTAAKEAIAAVEASDRPASDKAAEKQRLTAELLERFAEQDIRAGSIAELEEQLGRRSPWIEVGWDGDEPKVDALADPRGKVLKNTPDVARRFAFDGAWDNWLMFEHHPHNRRKYLLRAIADGASLMRRQPEGAPLTPFEYEKVYASGDQQRLKAFIDEVYNHLPEDNRRRIKKALDVAAMERINHKSKVPPYSQEQMWAGYTPLGEAERRMYADVPEESVKRMLMERGQAQWERDARELMIETLLIAVAEPAELLSGRINEPELAKLRGTYPGATKAKLLAAVREQLFAGCHVLMNPEHARALAMGVDDERQRPRDMVDRLLAEIRALGDVELTQKIERIAKEAAFYKVATDPGMQRARDPSFYEVARRYCKERLAAGTEALDSFRKNWESGKYTKEFVAERLFDVGRQRLASASAELLDAMGFRLKDACALMEDGKLSEIKIEFEERRFDAKKAFRNLFSTGNFDSALQVVLAYQEGGSEAAAWALAREIAMNLPYVAQVKAVYDFAAHGQWQGAFMAGSAILIPGAGHAYLLVSIATSSVTIMGHAVLDPLKDDDADKAYQGYLDEDNGFRGVERSQRFNVLAPVPIRVIPEIVVDGQGKAVTRYHAGPYSPEEAVDRGLRQGGEDIAFLQRNHLLGGGPDWDRLLAQASDWAGHPQLNFEAKRASLYYHFEDAAERFLKERGQYLEMPEAPRHLVEMFEPIVDQWVHGKGEYEGRVGGENELIERRFTPEIKRRIALRMTQDFMRSFQILHDSDYSVEARIRQGILQASQDQGRVELNGQILAMSDAYQGNLDPELAEAVDEVIRQRRDEASEPAPRIHVRPRVVSDSAAEDPSDLANLRIEPWVSLVADPEAAPPPYRFESQLSIRKEEAGQVLVLQVAVYDSRGQAVGDAVEQRIGVVEPRDSLPQLAAQESADSASASPGEEDPPSFWQAPQFVLRRVGQVGRPQEEDVARPTGEVGESSPAESRRVKLRYELSVTPPDRFDAREGVVIPCTLTFTGTAGERADPVQYKYQLFAKDTNNHIAVLDEGVIDIQPGGTATMRLSGSVRIVAEPWEGDQEDDEWPPTFSYRLVPEGRLISQEDLAHCDFANRHGSCRPDKSSPTEPGQPCSLGMLKLGFEIGHGRVLTPSRVDILYEGSSTPGDRHATAAVRK